MFTPTAEKLVPDLTPREELVVLARALWREGYNDHLAGHITVNLGDGTLPVAFPEGHLCGEIVVSSGADRDGSVSGGEIVLRGNEGVVTTLGPDVVIPRSV